MKKKIIAVDIDDVLSLTTEDILAYSNKHWGYSHTIEDYDEQIGQMWQVDEIEAERRWLEFLDSGTMKTYDVVPGAKVALTKLASNYKLIALTSRRAILLDLTKQWIETHLPDLFDSVHSARIYGEGKQQAHTLTKGAVLKELEAAYLIDDQPKHCLGAYQVGVTAVLFGEYPWTRDVVLPNEIVRCTDWTSILEYFNERRD